ncbi:MAG: multicopper oxidase domain-containing protein [Xanthobacteraceae bacterium]
MNQLAPRYRYGNRAYEERRSVIRRQARPHDYPWTFESGAENGFIHLHGHSFRLLDALDDGWKPFWLDTMPVAPGGKARIALVADNPGKWLIEGWVAPTPGSK